MNELTTMDDRSVGSLLGSWNGELALDGWVRGHGPQLRVLDKATGELLAELSEATAAQVGVAAAVTEAAQRDWAARSGEARAGVLEVAAGVLEQARREVVDWIVRETGSVSGKAHDEVNSTVEELLSAADLARQAMTLELRHPEDVASSADRVPHGVVGVITPWNVPLLLAARSLAPALAVGNGVVLKPDHQTPVSGGILLAATLRRAGLPRGVLTVVVGPGDPVGAAIVADPRIRMVSFTGSTAVGRAIAQRAAPLLKRVALELGGKNPHIVLDDADIDGAAAAGAWGTFLHQGQICMAIGRHIVDVGVRDEYVRNLTARAEALRLGNPALDDVELGPLINVAQAERVVAIIDDARAKGANVLAGGTRDGAFVAPTVLAEVTPEMRAYHEEIFGPVAVIITARHEEDAIRIANDTEYGLSASVHSASIERALGAADRIRAGMVHINGQPINDNAWSPMGGLGASGSGGRFGAPANLDMFTAWRWRTVRQQPDRGLFPPGPSSPPPSAT